MNNAPQTKLEVVRYGTQLQGYQNAAAYDAVRYIGRANEYRLGVTANAYKRLMGPLAGKKVLDVGCGTGRGVLDFAREAALVFGADASQDMLAIAANKRTPQQRCAFVRSYAQQLPFPDNFFDIVTALNFLHLFSLDTQRDMIADMKRVTRPGGSLVLEFDNALHGIIVGPWKRVTGRERGSLPGEIRYVLGDGYRLERIHGATFPVFWRLFQYAPRLFAQLEKIEWFPPFNRLGQRIYYKLVKEG